MSILLLASDVVAGQSESMIGKISNIEIIDIPTNDCWIRDYGPTFVVNESDQSIHGINWQYNAWGGKYPPYDLDNRIQIPSRRVAYTGETFERDGYTPHWRGVYDDDGRLMVAINFNMDIGDAWEHADWPDYPENMTALAYRFGINYVVYAMTH